MQLTLTGEFAEQFMSEKERIEEQLGHEISRPVALSLMMNTDVGDEIPLVEQKP